MKSWANVHCWYGHSCAKDSHASDPWKRQSHPLVHTHADSIHRKYALQLPLPTVYNEPASSTQMHRINTLSFPASECAAPSEYMTYPIPAFPHTCLSFITPSLPQSGQSCASLGRSFVPVRCGGTQTGPCRSSSKRRLWVIDPRYGDIMGVCHLSGQGTPAGWSSVSNSGLLASVPSVFSFYSLILIT